MKTIAKIGLALIVLAWLASVLGMTLEAQEKPAPEAAARAALLRENEALKREVLGLKATIRDREARLQLLQQNLDLALRVVAGDAEGDKAAQARCGNLEEGLRLLEKPPADAVFDCRAMTFKEKNGGD